MEEQFEIGVIGGGLEIDGPFKAKAMAVVAVIPRGAGRAGTARAARSGEGELWETIWFRSGAPKCKRRRRWTWILKAQEEEHVVALHLI